MKARITLGMMTIAMLLVTNPLLADKGKVLYEKSCTKCHSTEVFTRDDRSVRSIEGLKERVKQCSLAAESKWVDGEIDSVVKYLNEKFYNF